MSSYLLDTALASSRSERNTFLVLHTSELLVPQKIISLGVFDLPGFEGSASLSSAAPSKSRTREAHQHRSRGGTGRTQRWVESLGHGAGRCRRSEAGD